MRLIPIRWNRGRMRFRRWNRGRMRFRRWNRGRMRFRRWNRGRMRYAPTCDVYYRILAVL